MKIDLGTASRVPAGFETVPATDNRPRTRRSRTWRSALATLVLPTLLLAPGNARAEAIIQDYYVPMPEAQIRTSFLTLAPATNATMDSVISIVVAVAGTHVVYDHWEDGYEVDINNPVQSTTRIWGDGNDANGIVPGFVNDPSSINAGTVLALRNLVALPRNPSTILYDGRDRVGATRGIVMSRSAWATSHGPLLADATEVQSTIDWGTSFVMPIGQNVILPTPLTSSMFELTSMMVMASQNNTQVQIDTDGNGTVDITTVINQGESYQVASGVMRGATVVATKPVQVQLLTGDIGANYESRWYTIPSTDQWTPTYYSPVGTASNGEDTYIFLYNNNASTITINYTTQTGSGSFTIPTKSTYTFKAPQNSGTKFQSAGNEDFYAVGAVGAALTSNNVHDWGFDLVPSENLTTEMVVGWGPGSSDGTQNGSPVWVTPTAATTIYVDYNGDRLGPLTDPVGGKYDLAISSAALQVTRIFEPDRDQTGMRLYTLSGVLITGAWGQDPATAGPALPYLDVGTTVPNFPVPTMTKTSTLFNDVAPAGLSIGDTLTYTITVNNQGLVAIVNTIVLDTLPVALTYVPNTTTRDSVAIPDSGVTAFPLDESGITVPILPRRSSTVITFRAVIAASGSVVNTATASTGMVSTVVTPVPPGITNQCVLDFTNSGGTTVGSWTPGDSIYVTVTDADANTSNASAQTLAVTVTDTTSGDLETITLTETTVSSGIFRNTSAPLPSSSTTGLTPNDGTLYIAPGDSLVVNYTDPLYGDSCNDALGVIGASATKYLYLDTDGVDSDTTGDLDRVDPVNVSPADSTTSNTSTLAAPVASAVTTGSTTTGSGSGSTTLSFSHTAGSGSNRLLLVSVAVGGNTNNTAPGTISGVTYGGTALTLVGSLLNTQARTAIYALASPAAGPLNVVVTVSNTSSSIAASATTFTGVDVSSGLTTALGTYASASGINNSPSVATTLTTGQVAYSTTAIDEGASNQSITTPGGQSQLAIFSGFDFVTSATSTKTGTGTVTSTYTSGDTTQEWAAGVVPINPAAPSAGGSATFTQTPTLCENLVLPSGSVITSQVYFSTISGSMPATPSVSAVLRYGVTTVATSSSASSDGTKLTFTFPALGSLTTIPSGSALQLVVTNNDSGVTFQIQYDSNTKPSFVGLPTSTVIHVNSVGVYDAAYSGGSLTSSTNNGATLYVRTVVGDPFGFADITSLPLSIDGPGVTSDISTTLTDTNMVASTTCQKTYEYVWPTSVTEGTYSITATAKEGFENTVTSAKSTSVTLNQLDLGTPCTNTLTTGSNGPDATTYAANEQVCVKLTDLDQNTNSGSAETLSVTISSGAGDSEARTLTETGNNTGIFVGCVPASSSTVGTSNNGTLYAPLGTTISTTYTDPTDSLDICTDGSAVPAATGAISISKVRLTPAAPDNVAVIGESVQFRIRVTNTGNTTPATVAVTDTFPAANLTYVSASPSPNTVGSGTLTWNNVGPLAPGASVDLIVNFTALAVPASNPVTNSASVTATGGLTGNSSATVDITNPSLSVTKTLVSPSPGPAAKGTNVVWSINVANNGNTTIDTLPFEDTYSGACFTFVSASPTADGTGYGSILWNDLTGAGSLAAGGSTTVSVTLQASGACAPGTNTAAASFVTDTNGDPVPPVSSSATITTTAANISGFVYEDQGAAGFGGDIALEGVTVSLYTDPNGDGNPADGVLVQTQATQADGSYDFTNLGLGHYVVVETDPLGYSSISDTQGSATDNRIAVNVTTLTSFTGNNFLDDIIDVSTYGSIAGQVRNDTDGDGSFADADSGITGVTINLYTDPNGDGDYSDGVLFLTTTTDGSGNYSFPSIPPGNYVVVEVNSAGYNSTADVSGANDDKIPVVLANNGVVTGRDFLDTTLNLADLSITKTDGTATYTAGGLLTYTIVASNAGPFAVTGATVSDTFATQLTNTSWTCAGSGGGTCTASGTGNISQLVNLPVGASVTFTVTTTVIPGATVNPLVNTATVAVPSGTSDLTPGNNSATDSDTPTANTASIGDRLWVDEDGDGVQDAGEDGITGVTVGLYDATGTVLLATTVTDTDGRYIFTGRAAGTYVVKVDTTTMAAGLAANPTYDLDGGTATPNSQTSVTATAGVFTDTADFGYNWVPAATSSNPPLNATGTIGDRIWNDADGDGVQDFGESGISGVTVRLLVDSNGDGTYGGVGDAAAVTTTTSASGNYIFDGIAPGAYEIDVVTATIPSGFTTTPTGDPDSDGNNTTRPIVIAPGDVFLNADFGYTRPTGRTIGDTIYLDRNGNGTADAGEPGIAGVTVVLRNNSGTVIASTTTDASGLYSFPGLPDGTYTVVVTDTAGILLDTPTNTGDPDGGNNRQSTVVISGANNLAQDFGFAPAGHASGNGLIGDTIFLDRDASGTFSAGEGLQGVTVQLYDSTGTTLIATVVTDANGQYVFGGLNPAATYQVRVDTTTLPGGGAGLTNSIDPDGGTASRAQVNLSALGGTTVVQDFGYTAATPNTIGGTVWNDANGDGTLTGGETGRYAGVVVVLRDAAGNVVATTTTNASGVYSFPGLPDGTYFVDVAEDGNAIGGLSKSNGPSPGSDNNSQAETYPVTVTGGVVNTTGDFGYFRPGAAVGNFVWSDTDGDGIQDVGEPGEPDVVLTLTITYPNGDVTTVTTTSDAQGAYSFGSLLLDESFDGVGAGEPTYSIAATAPASHNASPVGVGGNPLVDSNDPAGSAALPVQGVTDTTNDALASNGIDFGFAPTNCTVDADCDDGLFCNGTETCTAGSCNAGTDPCAGGASCGNVCNEAADNCLVSAGTTCRASAGACDVAEACSGSSAACPANGFAAASTPCGDSSDTDCNNPDTCDGSGTCVDRFEPTSTACSDGQFCTSATGAPGAGDACNGLGNGAAACVGVAVNCNDGLFCTGTESCNELTDQCDSTGDPCPGTECNTCQEAGDTCFDPAATPCGDPSNTACDNPDTCNGAGVCLANNDPGSPSCVIADVAITKTDLTGPVQVQSFTRYGLTVTNLGPEVATNVVVTDTLDPSTTFVASTLGACSGGPGNTVTCDLGDLAPLDSVTFEVVVYIGAGAPTAGTDTGPSCPGTEDVCNRASVTTDSVDQNPLNDSAEVATDVVPATVFSELTVVKSDLVVEPVAPGAAINYEIVVTNPGPSDAGDVTVYETLDPFTTYVSDDAGCTVTDVGSVTGAKLTCALGTIPANGSASFAVVVTVSPGAPQSSPLEDGDCDASEDICNDVFVTTSSADVTVANNHDSEPTDVLAPVACGNGSVDAGEECDPPTGELCGNGIDDNGNLLVDCADPVCAVPGFESCDENCQLVAPCVLILDDPAYLRTNMLRVHGRYIPTTSVNPFTDGFMILVSNANGDVYRAVLQPGDLVPSGKHPPRWKFKDKDAKFGNGSRDGLYRVQIKQRVEPDGTFAYPFFVTAYADMSRATVPGMTTQVYIGNDRGYLTVDWQGKPGRWFLTHKQADTGR